MEGASFALAAGLERLRGLGVVADELRVVGGGSKNPLWRQVVADVTGLAVRLPSEPESAALGGALQSLALADDRPLLEALRAVDVPLVSLDGGRRDMGDDREDHRRHQTHDMPVETHAGRQPRPKRRDGVVPGT